jgi:hypothetical protein
MGEIKISHQRIALRGNLVILRVIAYLYPDLFEDIFNRHTRDAHGLHEL